MIRKIEALGGGCYERIRTEKERTFKRSKVYEP